jgi:hypothetical protein
MKKVSFFATIMLIAMLSLKAQSDKGFLYVGNKSFGFKPVFNIGFTGSNGYRPITKVSNLPDEVRFVPIHVDDTYASENDNGPIPDALLKIDGQYIIPFVSAGLGVNLHGIEIEAGIKPKFLSSPNHIASKEDKGYVSRRNYTNDPGNPTRGYGAALTYYSLNLKRGCWENFVEGSIPLFKPKSEDSYFHPRLFGGWSQTNGKVQVTRGYDRFNYFEELNRINIGEFRTTSWYVGLGIQRPLYKEPIFSFKVCYGKEEHVIMESYFQGIKFELSKGNFLRFTVGIRF